MKIPAVLALATLLSPVAADADPDRISLLLGSSHIGASLDFEEANPGVFLTWEGDRVDWHVGAYRNSFGRGSVAVLVGLPVLDGRAARVSILAGAALYPVEGRRFPIHLGDVVPMVGLQIQTGSLFLQAFPSDGKAVDAVIAAGVTFELQ